MGSGKKFAACDKDASRESAVTRPVKGYIYTSHERLATTSEKLSDRSEGVTDDFDGSYVVYFKRMDLF